jgi:hypothetical protein
LFDFQLCQLKGITSAMVVSSAASTHSSMQSMGNQLSNKMRNLALHHNPVVDISLGNSHGTHGTWVTSYSTMDTVEGAVSITAAHDTPFEDIEISFSGKKNHSLGTFQENGHVS